MQPLGGCALCLVVVVECDWTGCDYGDRLARQSPALIRGRNARSGLECAVLSQRRFLTKLDTGLWRFVAVDDRLVCRPDAVWDSLVGRVSRSVA